MRCAALLTIVSAALPLAGCQPAMFRVLAGFNGGEVLFTARPWAPWPVGETRRINADRLTIRDVRSVVWSIEREAARPDCAPKGERYPFPLRYGRTPRCFVVWVPPAPLRRDTLYSVETEGDRIGSGYFRIAGDVSNFDYDEIAGELRQWRELED